MWCPAAVGQNYARGFFQQDAEFGNAQYGRHLTADGSIKVLKFHFLDSEEVEAAWLMLAGRGGAASVAHLPTSVAAGT